MFNQIQLPWVCERLDNPSLFAEPVNIFTNIIFFWVAFKLRQKPFLAVLTGLIGIGSTLWHVFHTPMALIFDGLPIYLTILLFVFMFFSQTVGKKIAIIFTFALLIFQAGLYWLGYHDVGNVTIRHLVNVTVFPLLLYFGYRHSPKRVKYLFYAWICYALAILFRFLESAICPIFPIGTHFTWHILNALVIYFGGLFLIKNSPPYQRGGIGGV